MGNKNNIQLGVGAIVFKNDAVLLVKRKNPPQQHQWAIPGGRVNYGEPLKEAVRREILEETGIVVDVQESAYTFEVIETDEKSGTTLHYVIIDYTARYLSGNPKAADDAEQAEWISREDFHSLDISHTTKTLLAELFQFP